MLSPSCGSSRSIEAPLRALTLLCQIQPERQSQEELSLWASGKDTCETSEQDPDTFLDWRHCSSWSSWASSAAMRLFKDPICPRRSCLSSVKAAWRFCSGSGQATLLSVDGTGLCSCGVLVPPTLSSRRSLLVMPLSHESVFLRDT